MLHLETRPRTIVFLLILLFTFFLLFYSLGSNHLTNWDEAWYAAVSRTMAETGNFVTPMWNTRPFFEKPPLYYWASALAMRAFGVSEFNARIFSALSGVGTVALVFFIAKTLWKNSYIALGAMCILNSTIGFLYRSRTGNMDTFLGFWILLSVYSFLRLGHHRNWVVIFAGAITAAFLTKGFIGWSIPIVLVGLHIVRKQPFEKRFWMGLVGASVLCLAWFAVYALLYGSQFTDQFFAQQGEKIGFEVWKHFSLGYIEYLRQGLKLWFLIAIPAFFYAWWRLKESNAALLIVYLTAFLGALSFFQNKSDWFLVPAYPFIALIASFFVFESVSRILGAKWQRVCLAILLLFAIGQDYRYWSSYVTPDIAGDEARVAVVAQRLTRPGDSVYLTNYYYPTTVYYSQRGVYAVYSNQEYNRAWWIEPVTAWAEIVKQPRVFVITTETERRSLSTYLGEKDFDMVYQSGEKLLLQKKEL